MEGKRRTKEGNDTGKNSGRPKDNEHPLPPIQTSLASEICNTTGNGRRETTDLYVLLAQYSRGRQSATHYGSRDVETCHSFLDLRSQIPCTDDIGTWYIIQYNACENLGKHLTSWEEACL